MPSCGGRAVLTDRDVKDLYHPGPPAFHKPVLLVSGLVLLFFIQLTRERTAEEMSSREAPRLVASRLHLLPGED